MRILFAHHNAPGQFGRLAGALADRGHDVVFVGQRLRQDLGKVRFESYRPGALQPVHHLLTDLNRTAENGRQVFTLLRNLANDNWIPDLVIGHDGWGELTFVKDALPQAKVAAYFEYFYRPSGQDVDFDPEFRSSLAERARIRTRNLGNLLGLAAADGHWTPTRWQHSVFPSEWREKISVIHDGVDTQYMSPLKEPVALQLPNSERLGEDTPLITFVARNLEPYRGFHIFMRALPRLLKALPKARIVLVGGDDVSYGRRPSGAASWRDCLLREVSIDQSRVFFIGRVSYGVLRALFRATSAHVYMTYPFVLSWSMLEAMACGAAVVASRTSPVTEVIADNENGLLFDFFDTDALVERTLEAVANGPAVRKCRAEARATIIKNYDFKSVCLPAQLNFLRDVSGVAV